MVGFLLSVTFARGLLIAVAHVVNERFIAPAYDVVANIVACAFAFACAVAASVLLEDWIPALLSSGAIVCWFVLSRRTTLAYRHRGV